MSTPMLSFTQSNRLLQLTLAPGSGIGEDVLLPYELTGDEGISSGFTYTLVCLSSDAFLELKQFIGVPAQLAILTDDGSQRALCGLITAARQEGSDGGFTRYALTLQDPMTILGKRINSRVFQDLTVREFALQLLQEHRQANPVLAACFDIDDRCRGAHPKQSWATQYNESDSAFLGRWFAQEGISWYIEHGDGGVPGDHPKMTLVLFDDPQALQPASAAKIRFHRDDGTEAEDVIDQWQATRTLQPGSTQQLSYDYKNVVTSTQQDDNRNDQGEHGQQLAATLEDYRYESHHAANDSGDFARYGRLRVQAHEYAAKSFTGAGTHRELAVGRHFELTQHDVHDQDPQEDRQFTVTRHTLYARNNLPAELHDSAAGLLKPQDALEAAATEPVYRTRFDAARRTIPIIPIIPAFSRTEHAKPVAPTMLTAIVVGPPGEEIHVNELGCVKIRLGFTRSADHAHAEGAGASGTDRDSIWVRVSQPWAGTEYGHVWIPRVGDEVIVHFMQGDIDRPVIGGSLYNGTHRPATFSDAGGLPGNKALSGIKSKMVKGSGYNEIIWDDSTGEQRIRVATDHGNSALNAGYLVHPRSGGKGEPRGEGIELRTDDYAAIRAGKGLLISTDARENARSTHLDSKELTTQLQGSLALSQVLSEAAGQHHADPLDANAEAERLIKVASQTYTQTGGTGQQAVVPGYAEPLLALSSPAGIVAATPKTQQIAAGEHLHLSSQQDTNIAVGKRLSIAIKDAWSVFAATAGIKLFAGKGKVQIQAQDDALEATAKKNIQIASIAGEISISTPNKLSLTAGGSQIALGGGNIDIKAPGAVNIHGAPKNLAGPAGGNYSGTLPAAPMKKGDVELSHFYETMNEPIKGAKYKAILADGSVRTGVLNAAGKAILSNVPKGGLQVFYNVDPRKFEEKPDWYRIKDDSGYEPTEFMKKLREQFAGDELGAHLSKAASTVAGVANAASALGTNVPGIAKATSALGVAGKAAELSKAAKAASALRPSGK